jgi:hypothetical protein
MPHRTAPHRTATRPSAGSVGPAPHQAGHPNLPMINPKIPLIMGVMLLHALFSRHRAHDRPVLGRDHGRVVEWGLRYLGNCGKWCDVLYCECTLIASLE